MSLPQKSPCFCSFSVYPLERFPKIKLSPHAWWGLGVAWLRLNLGAFPRAPLPRLPLTAGVASQGLRLEGLRLEGLLYLLRLNAFQ